MAGRPTKLTPERQEKIIQAILAGNYFSVACRYAGVPDKVGYEWLARGEGKDKDRKSNALYAGFADAIRLAESQAEVGTVTVITQGLPENPRLALDFLARRHPSRWGPRETITLLRKLADEVEGMTDDEILQAAHSRRAGGTGEGAADPGGSEAAGAGGGDSGD